MGNALLLQPGAESSTPVTAVSNSICSTSRPDRCNRLPMHLLRRPRRWWHRSISKARSRLSTFRAFFPVRSTTKISETTARSFWHQSPLDRSLGRQQFLMPHHKGENQQPSTQIAPGSIATIRGSALAFKTEAATFTGEDPPFTVAGSSVKVNGQTARIFYAAPNEVVFIVPDALPNGPAEFVVTNDDGFSSKAIANISSAAPGVFTGQGDGRGEAVILNSDTLVPASFDPSSGQLRLSIFATGIRRAGKVSVTVRGRPTIVETVGPAGLSGLDEIHVLVPAELSGAGISTLVVTADGVQKQFDLRGMSGSAPTPTPSPSPSPSPTSTPTPTPTPIQRPVQPRRQRRLRVPLRLPPLLRRRAPLQPQLRRRLRPLLPRPSPSPSPSPGVSTNIVISQVFGGGGNSGAPFRNDFIEIFNSGTAPVDLAGWSVQYASATASTWSVTPLTSVVLLPGQYYLVQESSGGSNGILLPTAGR